MSATHTPGPWHLRTVGGRLPILREHHGSYGEASTWEAVVGAGDSLTGPIVARLDFGYVGHHDRRERHQADARLIAAAPDLREMLQRLLRAYEQDYLELTDGQFDSPSVLAAARALLACIDGD